MSPADAQSATYRPSASCNNWGSAATDKAKRVLSRFRLYSSGWSGLSFGGGPDGRPRRLVEGCDDDPVPVHSGVGLGVEVDGSVHLGISTALREVAILKFVSFGVGVEEAADPAFERSDVKDL